ncbi:unnamed protein product [Allacma fusca]|uniref:Uncharacterized protein n=1 Tax=Allacma fusca TaxID=39272 RepID=A0A8J2PLQ3_9HEXA|nr:unnamed protein product [Allacma fusca]
MEATTHIMVSKVERDGSFLVKFRGWRPHSPELLSSLFPNPNTFTLRVAVTAFQFVYMHVYVANALLIVQSFVPALFCVLEILRETCDENSNILRRNIREAGRMFRVYRNLQVLLSDAMDTVFVIFRGGKVLMISFAIFCTYGAIRLPGIMALTMAVIGFNCTVLLAILLDLMGNFHHKSTQILRYMNLKYIDDKLMKRRLNYASLPTPSSLRFGFIDCSFQCLFFIVIVFTICGSKIRCSDIRKFYKLSGELFYGTLLLVFKTMLTILRPFQFSTMLTGLLGDQIRICSEWDEYI